MDLIILKRIIITLCLLLSVVTLIKSMIDDSNIEIALKCIMLASILLSIFLI